MGQTTEPSYEQRVSDAPGRTRRWLDRLRGKRITYDMAPYVPTLHRVAAEEEALAPLDADALRARADALRARVAVGAPDEEVLAPVFALVREAARRALGLRPFDVQVIGAVALHQGRVVEMATGEGKTLVAVLPAVLEAFRGHGVHVLTFNDYLAARDAAWMGPAYEALGLSVGVVQAGMEASARRAAYAADVTYVTAKEAGFDYLRDGLVAHPDDRVHRELAFAVVDEADSIMIDEARIPLVIAGTAEPSGAAAGQLAAVVGALREGVDFEVDPAGRSAVLTETGERQLEHALGGDLYAEESADLLARLNLALHARALLTRDVDYIVRDGRVDAVDALTGRAVPDRRWPDGLQRALEAKEGLTARDDGVILGSITLQHFLGLYDGLAGMTATARPDTDELLASYGLEVVVVPPNRPCVRVDVPARLFADRDAKEEALLATIVTAHERGRPVLVGTASVRESERLAGRLRSRGLACAVLNAKTDALEARIVAEAGALGAITIATNMAGRGTDIHLGGADARDRDAVVARGGLCVIGTALHESRRIDRQLRGRAGRQGDPGSSELFVSLDDELIVESGADAWLRSDARRLGARAGRRLAWLQRVVEGRSFDARQRLNRYAAIPEGQRARVRATRDRLVDGDAPARWSALRPDRWARLVALVGAPEAAALETRATLRALDARWAAHLERVNDLRVTIHATRLANADPMAAFLRAADQAFGETLQGIEADALETLDGLALTEAGVAACDQALRVPRTTWTYLVEDDPWRDALELHVAPDLAMSIGAAIHYPIYMMAVMVRRLRRR